MDSFEEAFDNATKVADVALKANQDLSKQLRGLRKASLAGNITAVKREQSRLTAGLDELTEAVNNVGVAWPFDDEQEVQYLKAADGYAAELRRVASEKGLLIRERDGQMICHPFIVRVIPVGDGRSASTRRRFPTIRPSLPRPTPWSRLKRLPSRFRPQSFLEALYKSLSIV